MTHGENCEPEVRGAEILTGSGGPTLSLLRPNSFFLLHHVALEYSEGETGILDCCCISGDGVWYEGRKDSSFDVCRKCFNESALEVLEVTDLAALAEVLLRNMAASLAASAPRARTWRAVMP